jgi:hypothetical protein
MTLWTFGSITQVRVSDTPKRVVACLVGAGQPSEESEL